MRWSAAFAALLISCAGKDDSSPLGDNAESAIADESSEPVAEVISPDEEDPCQARNPIVLSKIALSHSHGKPQDVAATFSMPAASTVCLRRTIETNGKGFASSAYVEVDGNRVWSPQHFQRDRQNEEKRIALAEGLHELAGQARGQKNVVVLVEVIVAGPWIAGIDQLRAQPGGTVTITGGSLRGALTVHAGATSLPIVETDSAGAYVRVRIVDGMPIGPLTVTNEWGSATSAQPFIPVGQTRRLPIFPLRTALDPTGDGLDDITKVQLFDDGRSVAIIVDSSRAVGTTTLTLTPLATSSPIVLSVSTTGTGAAESGGVQAARVGGVTVFAIPFDVVKTRDVETFGAFVQKIETAGPSGDLFPDAGPGVIHPTMVPSRLIFKSSVAPSQFAATLGGTFIDTESRTGISLMDIAEGQTLEDAFFAAALHPNAKGVLPEAVMSPDYKPIGKTPDAPTGCVGSPFSPPFRAQDQIADSGGPANSLRQFSMFETRAREAWAFGRGQGVKVIVLDSGINPDHHDITPNFAAAHSALVGTDRAIDILGHGTTVASIIAGFDGNGGMVGVAPDAKIISVRIWGKGGFGEAYGGLVAMSKVLSLHAQDSSIRVVNMSGGFATGWEQITVSLIGLIALADLNASIAAAALRAATYALGEEVADKMTFVASSGNNDKPWSQNGTGNPLEDGSVFPANVAGAISVGAVDAARVVTFYSTLDPTVAIAAPVGTEGVPSADFVANDRVACSGAGTSFSAPQVAGAAALLYSIDPSINPEFVRQVLVETAVDISGNAANTRDAVGAGLLDVLGAAAAVSGRITNGAFDTALGPTARQAPRDTAYAGQRAYYLSADGRTILLVMGDGSYASIAVPSTPNFLPWDFIVGTGLNDGQNPILLGGNYREPVISVFTVDSGVWSGTIFGMTGSMLEEPTRLGGTAGQFLVPTTADAIALIDVRGLFDASVQRVATLPGAQKLALEPRTSPTAARALLVYRNPSGDPAVPAPVLDGFSYNPTTRTVTGTAAGAAPLTGIPTSIAIGSTTLQGGSNIGGCDASGYPPFVGTYGPGSGFRGAVVHPGNVRPGANACSSTKAIDVFMGLDVIGVVPRSTPGRLFGYLISDGSIVTVEPALGIVTGRMQPPQPLSLSRPSMSDDGTKLLFVDGTAVIDPNDSRKPALYYGVEVYQL